MNEEKRTGQLVLVATPIGNLGDVSDRARAVLRSADIICAEDTRRTRKLLSALAIPAGRRLVSLHSHSEVERTPQVIAWVAEGRTVALVSDAGVPVISDPGQRLVREAARHGCQVTAVPGPSALLTALAVSGLPADRFCFEGFLPRRGAERRRCLEALASEQRTCVLFEAPGRLHPTLCELLERCGDRDIAIARELTKVHEEVWRGSLARAVEAFARRAVRGEVVIVLGGKAPGAETPSDVEVRRALEERLSAGEGPRKAAETVADELGVPRRRAYRIALVARHETPGTLPPCHPPTSPPPSTT